MRCRRAAIHFAILLALAVGGTGRALAFDCAEKYCSRMSSCAEAHHKLTVCGQSERDADNDGIPCENICGKTMKTFCALLELEGVTSALPAQCPQR
jgi:hypothetical protein